MYFEQINISLYTINLCYEPGTTITHCYYLCYVSGGGLIVLNRISVLSILVAAKLEKNIVDEIGRFLFSFAEINKFLFIYIPTFIEIRNNGRIIPRLGKKIFQYMLSERST